MGIQERLFRAAAVKQDKQHEKARLRAKDISRRKTKKIAHGSDWNKCLCAVKDCLWNVLLTCKGGGKVKRKS